MAALTVMGVLMIMITYTGISEWVCSQFLQIFQNINYLWFTHHHLLHTLLPKVRKFCPIEYHGCGVGFVCLKCELSLDQSAKKQEEFSSSKKPELGLSAENRVYLIGSHLQREQGDPYMWLTISQSPRLTIRNLSIANNISSCKWPRHCRRIGSVTSRSLLRACN